MLLGLIIGLFSGAVIGVGMMCLLSYSRDGK